MNRIDNQNELALARPPQQTSVPVEMIRAKRNSGAAFSLACDASGLDDKEIYLALEIDAGYFSNIKKSKATLQGDLVRDFCRVVGNTIYPEWLAYQVGCTLVMLRSEAERRADDAERRARDAEEKLLFLTKIMQGKVTP
ncbi:transcriptional regulator [Undibacterium sp. Ji50W]|uniref:transcriptional regulator n=1 Tax=Undibacterium sp. Ji50W TaxID=3413041 RepID=UPI003BF45BFA